MLKQKRIGRIGLMAALAAFLLLNTPGAVIGDDIKIDPNLEKRIKNPTFVKTLSPKASYYTIWVILIGDPKLKDRKLKLTLKRLEGGEVSVIKSINKSGNLSHKFKLGPDPIKTNGTYYLEVTKGPKLSPADPDRLNVCFDGIEPERFVWYINPKYTLSKTKFKIKWSIRWKGSQCW